MVDHPNRSRAAPKITDLSNISVTEVEITEPEVQAAIDSLWQADKSARYAKWLKRQVEAVTGGGRVEGRIGGGLSPNSVLMMVCMLIAHAKENPNGNFHRICLSHMFKARAAGLLRRHRHARIY
jgi:hypothetical protein